MSQTVPIEKLGRDKTLTVAYSQEGWIYIVVSTLTEREMTEIPPEKGVPTKLNPKALFSNKPEQGSLIRVNQALELGFRMAAYIPL
jgi:hypothetical protein